MLQKILKFAFENKKNFLFFGIFLSLFFLSYSTGFATGDEPVLKPEDAEKVVKILNGFIMGAAALMGMVTSFITLFLYPGWINGTLFGLDEYLKEIWILISNVVYFIFAFILIAIAFMNIIGKGEGTWELKQAMPKFIVGVLIVPFSWFFVQLVLSVCSVLTVGILTLPYDSFKDKDLFSQALESQQFADEKICKDIVIAFDGDFTGQNVESISTEENGLDENIKCKTDGKLTIKELLTGKDENGNASGKAAGLQNSIFGVISIYSYGILRIHELDTISQSDLANMKSIADLVFKIVFDLLFIAVYLLLMIALLLALFVRGIRLWIFAMLSPAFGLLYFFGKGSEGIGSDKNKFSIKEFISLALVPVYVSAALAFGLVFILVASTGIQKEASPEKDTLQIGGFSLTLIGAHGDGEVDEVSIIGKLIVEIFGVVILWIAVMAALGASNTTKNIVEPIQQFGNSVGELAMKAPTYAPIIPTADGKGMSVTALGSMGSQIKNAIAGEQTSRGSEFGTGIANRMGIGDSATSQLTNSMSRFSSALESSEPMDVSTQRDALRTLMSGVTAGTLGSNSETKRQFNRYMRQLFRDEFTDDMERKITTSSEGNIDDRLREIFSQLSSTHGSTLNGVFGSANPSLSDVQRVLQGSDTSPLASGGTPPNTASSPISISPSNVTNVTFNATTGAAENTDALLTSLGTNATEANEPTIRAQLASLRGVVTGDPSSSYSNDQIDEIIEALNLS